MKQLIIFARPKIVVVTGRVVKIESNKVMIENDLYQPVSKCIAKRWMEISFEPHKITSMKLKKGSFIIATVKDNDIALQEVISGGESDTMVFVVTGYNLRYSGTYDFDGYGEYRETHVIVGQVEDIRILDNGYVTFSILCFRRGERLVMHAYARQKTAKNLSSGDKIAVVAEKQDAAGRFPVRRIINC